MPGWRLRRRPGVPCATTDPGGMGQWVIREFHLDVISSVEMKAEPGSGPIWCRPTRVINRRQAAI